MRTIITARHGDVPDELRERAEALVERLSKLAHRPTSARVTFDLDHQAASAEVRLFAARGAVHIAAADGPDHRSALDRVASKLRRQLDKLEPPARMRRHRAAVR